MVKKKLCLNMIVKNESHVILESLNSVKKYIDYWVICDTGSTDGTQKLIKDFFKKENIPGELHQHEWKNFGYNRTLAFKEARNKSDYVWVIDADDYVSGEIIFPKYMTADVYYLQYGGDVKFERRQIFKNRKLKWIYVGAIHESSKCINKKNLTIERIRGNYYINARTIGNRNKDPEKYLKDAELCIIEMKKPSTEKNRNRMCYYAAQGYFDYKDYNNALKYYKKRIQFGKNEKSNEMYQSYYRIAKILIYLKKDNKDIVSAFLEAYKHYPERAETLHDLAMFYKNNNDYINSKYYSELSIKIPYPKITDGLIDKSLYDWKMKFMLADTYFKLNEYSESFNLCNQLLTQNQNSTNIEYKMIEILKYKNVKFTIKNYTKYNIKIINLITKFINSSNNKNNITFAIISKNFDSFQKTINSFINCCTDLLKINKWICIDENSSNEHRKQMKELYPFFDFIFKKSNEIGYAKSMNIIKNKITSQYLIFVEDGWIFFHKKKYINDAINILNQKEITVDTEIKKIGQIMFNKNYIKNATDIVLGGYSCKINNNSFIVNEYYNKNSDKYNKAMDRYNQYISSVIDHVSSQINSNTSIQSKIQYILVKEAFMNIKICINQQHYSLHPSIINTDIFKEIGDFKENDQIFENDYANKYFNNNYITLFYDTISCTNNCDIMSSTKNISNNKINKQINIQINKKITIGLLIPTISKNIIKNKIDITLSCLYKIFIPSFIKTTNNKYNYIIYIGYNHDDILYNNKKELNKLFDFLEKYPYIKLKMTRFKKKIKKGHLTKMWNILFKKAYDDNCDYFYQCGDDILFLNNNWIDKCIETLKNNNEIGIVGPIDDFQKNNILTQTFVSKKHMDIFGYYFPEEIKNWGCDDWINQIYSPNYINILSDYKHKNFFKALDNETSRYKIIYNKKTQDLLITLVNKNKIKIKKYIDEN